MLTSPIENLSQKLNLIDDSNDHENDDDLYTVALQFRLLRQQGYRISCEKFTKFKETNGNFKESLISDARGMLSLYEATYLKIHGEAILDEALVFTATHLESIASHLSPPLAAQVSHALKQPIHKGLPRLEARHFFTIYQEDPSHDKVLLTFAKLDFNLLQKMHQKEVSDLARWDISAIVTKDSFEWVFSNPKIVRVCTVVTKLMDDMVSHKFEQKRGHVASAVECYMAQHGATEEEATNELCKQVKDAWKDINEECLNPTTVPMPLLTRILNLARVMDVVYKDEDGYTNAGTVLKDFIASMLIDPVPL
uniref:Uncharacterized protein n=1 Tax=Fagus sylvatica TaxID=28930 RepID=A0A2N9FGB4_FAGSY